ncbi:proteasome regulatory particle base subunit [Ceratobasidium sp. 423]|nr:proteasome regulatory particle base subunit [Ceratobasidium sp. 423]
MVAQPRTSAAGILALLAEPELEVKQRALAELIGLVPDFWTEISEEISAIEALSESPEITATAREDAALVASKVYYYLGQYDDALSFALRAGNAFETESKQERSAEYAETIVSNAIDRYIAQRVEFADATDPSTLPNSGADSDKIDPRLRSIIERIFTLAIEGGDVRQALGIALESSRLDIITRIFEHTHDTDLLSYAMDAVLDVGFNLATRNRVLNHLCPLFPLPKPGANYTIALTRLHVALATPIVTTPLFKQLIDSGDKTNRLLACQLAFDLVEGSTQDFLKIVSNSLPSTEDYELIRQILSGADSIRLKLDFLQRNNKVDLLILKHTKESLEHRSSVYHNALTLSNAFMHAGTTSDVFLRNNLDWLGRASNWSKFSATGAFGVIHKGNVAQAMELLGPYLPGATSGAGSSPFSEGGALFALGIVHAGRGSEVESFLREKAAAYAMGLVMLGSGSRTATDEMLAYAHETQHEKIIRGLAIGVAFLYYGRQESADAVIENGLKEKDPLLRYGGVYTLALAYAGTGDSRAVRKLLHVAVSDTSDDVRRAAVTALAFLLFKSPTQVPRIVQLLSESYNPHVRCGATLALGLACAGTGLQDAIDLLQPMTKDPVDFVRQGAFISLGMILVQQSEASSPSLSSTRALYHKIVSDKHEDPMARFGAALGQGFIDAGGRNCSISLQSRTGSGNMSAIVGMTPSFEFISNARPALFAYPALVKPPTKEAIEKVATAVLSTTAKAKAREKTKEKEKAATEGERMETDDTPAPAQDEEMKVDEPAPAPTPKRTGPAPTSETLQNLSRVTPAQMQFITFPTESRFQPVRPIAKGGGGIVMLVDKKEGEDVEWIQPFGTETDTTESAAQTEGQAPASEEAPPPPSVQFKSAQPDILHHHVFIFRSSKVEKRVFNVQEEATILKTPTHGRLGSGHEPRHELPRPPNRMTSGQAALLNALFSLGAQSTSDRVLPTPTSSYLTPPSTNGSAWPSPDTEQDQESETSEESDPEGVRQIVCGTPTLEPTVQSNSLQFVLYSYATMATRTIYEPLKMASQIRDWVTERFHHSDESRAGVTLLAGIFHTMWSTRTSAADYIPMATRVATQIRQKIVQTSSSLGLIAQNEAQKVRTLHDALEIINLQIYTAPLKTMMDTIAETAPLFRSACPEAHHELIDLPAKLTHPNLSLRHFAVVDVLVSVTTLRPMQFRYNTHPDKDFRDREDVGMQWFNGVPGELILIMARINMLLSDYWASVDPAIIVEIEQQLTDFKSMPGRSPDAYLMVARLACLCLADAKDPRVEKVQRSFMRVLDRTKPNRTPDVFLMAPMSIVGRVTYRPRERELIRQRLLNLQECSHPGTSGNDVVRILEKVWARADAEGRPAVWSDARVATLSVCGV